ncbi:hypothetical protein [Novosphingobium cyanobacteriorum]|uniref:Uncharacterized protein n=1 Tax=Novosphingobium cyanobacteriorum TaxID=3024215 RepID=A0ABT6CJ86_9SPHN|nr:hypothetical protein [Novosphingobium cyanobacteriorum]MDF8333970.1 hypothetical protein [Novosphingobium cyanobacteriorum]
MTVGWKIEPDCRARLLELVPPRYVRVVADHVTRRPFNEPDAEPPPPISNARIVGRADDGTGVETLVVAMEGTTARPDGGIWHITWSLAEGRSAKESNELLSDKEWEPFDGGPLKLTPAVW